MDQQLSPSIPRIIQPAHSRTPSRASARMRLASDDILSDLTPDKALEVLTSPSNPSNICLGPVTPNERAFGVRAAIASKKIQEWMEELLSWSWPISGGSAGFEISPLKRKKHFSSSSTVKRSPLSDNDGLDADYRGCLSMSQFSRYETRINKLRVELDDLRVEEIKRHVLDNHFSARSRPSSSCSNLGLPSFLSSASYSRMDDYTALVTTTVLQALPNLRKLVNLIDTWAKRLQILKMTPALLIDLEDAEIAMESGWKTIRTPNKDVDSEDCNSFKTLSRQTYEVIRYVLQDKVMTIAQRIDFMLDTLEGSNDTLPDSWIERMESLEKEYGEWVVSGDNKVITDEWLKLEHDRNHNDILPCSAEISNAAESIAKKEMQQEDSLLSNTTTESTTSAASEREVLNSIEESYIKYTTSSRSATGCESTIQMSWDSTQKSETSETSEILARSIRKVNDVSTYVEPMSQSPKGFERPERLNSSETNLISSENHFKAMTATTTEDNTCEKLFSDYKSHCEYGDHTKLVHNRAHESLKYMPSHEPNIFNIRSTLSVCKSDDSNKFQLSRIRLSDSFVNYQGLNSFQRTQSEITQRPISAHICSSNCNELEETSERNILSAESLGLKRLHESVSYDSSSKKNSIGNSYPQLHSREDKFGSSTQSTSHTKDLDLDLPKADSKYIQKAISVQKNLVASSEIISRHDFVSNCSPSAVSSPSDRPASNDKCGSTSPVLLTESCYVPKDEDENFVHENTNTPTSTNISNLSKHSTLNSRNVMTDGCVESRFSDRADHQINGDFNVSRKIKSKKGRHFINSLSVSVQPFIQSKTVLQEESKKSCSTSLNTSLGPSSDVKKLEVPDIITPVVSSSHSVEIKFHSVSGLEHYVNLFLDGRTTYTNYDLPVSMITSNINIVDLCEVTSTECKPNLIPGLPGTFNISPPQTIVTITYHGVNTIQPQFDMLNQNPKAFSEESIDKTSISPKFLGDHISKKPSRNSKQSPHIIHEKIKGKMSPVLEEASTFSSNMSHVKKMSNDYGFNSEQSEDNDYPINPRENESPSIDHSIDSSPLDRGKTISPVSSNIAGEESETKHDLIDDSSALNSSMGRKLLQMEDLSSYQSIDYPGDLSFDISPPDSPLLRAQKPRSISFGPDCSEPLKSLVEPSFGDHYLPPTANQSSYDSPKVPKKNDQFHQQISSLLQSIPSLICLSPESCSTIFTPDSLRPRKTRRKPISQKRSASSLSNYSLPSRTSTPSFTLTPAPSKSTSRSRYQSCNSEIRVYHLSRSNGEAPIKLFVRLVGERGERVMVRVGGGWADLGEYLKEFASHHGRRTVTDTVKLYDIPMRNISSSTIKSSSLNRETGRSSPPQRPRSVVEHRPKSSLNVPKTRKSVGVAGQEYSTPQSRLSGFKDPMTPVSDIKHITSSTPPSVASSNGTVVSGSSEKSSRMSWIDEEFNLGLAGPCSKKSTISERDLEWVESMKEKVRLASSEKERRVRERTERLGRIEKPRVRGSSFGDLEKLGSSGRLFSRDRSES